MMKKDLAVLIFVENVDENRYEFSTLLFTGIRFVGFFGKFPCALKNQEGKVR